MYGKIFDSMYDGTISANWQAMVTFQQLIVLCDADGVVDMTPPAIARRTGIPLEIIEAGIDYLEKPDPYSRSPEQEGRRIIRLEEHRPWGWEIVNHAHYKSLQDADEIREKNRIRKQKQREREKLAKSDESLEDCDNSTEKRDLLGDVTGCHTGSRHTDTDTNTNKTFEQFWDVYPNKKGRVDAQKKWPKLKPEEQQLAIADCQKRYVQTAKQFIPYGSTYLNKKPWQDEPPSDPTGNETSSYGAGAL